MPKRDSSKIREIGQSAAKLRIGEGSTTIPEMEVQTKQSGNRRHPTGVKI